MRLELDPVAVTRMPVVNSEAFDDYFLDESSLDALLKKGVAAAQSGDRDVARKLLSRASAIDPNSEDAWMWLASISDYPEELLAFLDRVLAINSNNSQALEWRQATRSLVANNFVQRAVAAREQGSDDLAARCIDQAIEFDNNFAPAWFVRAAMCDDDDQRLGFYDRVLELEPDHDEAKKAIVAINNTRTQAVLENAKQAAMHGDQAAAMETLDGYIESVPDSVDAWILKSHLSQSVEQKINALEKALEIDPENAAARSGLAFLALTFGSNNQDAAPSDVETEVTAPADPAAPFIEEVSVEAVSESTVVPSEEAYELSYNDDLIADDEPADFWDQADTAFEADAPRSVEDLSGPVHVSVDAENKTVESFSPFDYKVSEAPVVEGPPTEDSAPAVDGGDEESFSYAETAENAYAMSTGPACPFCGSANDPQSFDCGTCKARLTLSDIEALLSERNVDRDLLQAVVTQMEAEWNLREFNESEMTALALGHLNLGNMESGLKYLHEASRLDSNNVILAGQVNALAIRLEDIRRQNELYETRLTGKRILVVDDSPTVRKLIAGKLEKSGHVVVCASDGVEALEQLESDLPDLVLLDITMPRMDGYEVCKQIRSNPQAKDLPVVMISGKDGFFDKVRGRMAGSTGYVTKPFGPETLMKALETYLLPEA